jgi:hypothetical protein
METEEFSAGRADKGVPEKYITRVYWGLVAGGLEAGDSGDWGLVAKGNPAILRGIPVQGHRHFSRIHL